MLLVDVLTQEEMEAIEKRQVQQQSEWKNPPCRPVRIIPWYRAIGAPRVFPPKEDTVLLTKHLPTKGAVTVLDVR